MAVDQALPAFSSKTANRGTRWIFIYAEGVQTLVPAVNNKMENKSGMNCKIMEQNKSLFLR